MLFQFRICCYFLVQQKANFSGFEFNRGRVYCSMYGSSGSCVALEATCRIIWAYVGAYCDSPWQPELCLDVSESSHHDQTKHVEMRYYYVRDMVQRRVVELQFVPTDEQVADVLTKLLVRGKFEGFWKMLRIVDDVSLSLRESVDVYSFVIHHWFPPGWQRMGNGSSLSLCIQWGCNDVDGCGLWMRITIVGSLQASRGWAMCLRFPSVFSEDVTMWMDADCGRRLPSLVPSRLVEDGRWIFAFPLYSVRM